MTITRSGGVVWQPSYLSDRAMKDLGTLVRIDFLLAGSGDRLAEAARICLRAIGSRRERCSQPAERAAPAGRRAWRPPTAFGPTLMAASAPSCLPRIGWSRSTRSGRRRRSARR